MSSQGLGVELAEARPFEAKRRAVCFTRASVVFSLGVGPNGLALRLVQHQPTQYPASEEMSIGKIKFNAFDLGGHQIAHRVWKDFYAKDSSSFIIPDKPFSVYLIHGRQILIVGVC
uniref:Uncharacterized protein n=1 Tax=Quercus lobata TaxID=97700 RepID=A0A7N2R0Z5_QUELO